MSGSDKLRQTIANNKIGSAWALNVEKQVVAATKMAVEKMILTNPNYQFTWDEELKKSDIHSILKKQFSDPSVGSNLTVVDSGIKPDGGFIYIETPNKNKLLLGATEAKKQGTNDLREEEGLKKQARGNAVERTNKNYVEIGNYFLCEDIFPYLIFMKGCDLEDTATSNGGRGPSSIRDRITSMNLGCPFNVLYVNKLADNLGRLHPRASIFIGAEDIKIMSDTIFEMLDISMKYYINKYPGEFNDLSK